MFRTCLLAALVSCCSIQAHEFVRDVLEDELDSVFLFDRRGRNGRYEAPSFDQLDRFRAVVQLLASGDYGRASDEAFRLNYKVRVFHDTATDSDHVILEEFPGADRHGGGTFILRQPDSGPVAPIVIQNAHPVFDRYTKDVGIALYLQCRAQALMIAGAHRHNGLDPSPRGPRWTNSDAAHNVDTYFQVFHEEIAMAFPQTTAVSLHSMRPRSPKQDISVSNGTTEDLSGSSYSKQLAAILNDVFQENRRTRSFVALSHQDAGSGAALPGTTNVQGRFSNGSHDPLFTPVISAPQPERFLHFEHSTSLLRKRRDAIPAIVEAFQRLFEPVYVKRAGGLSSRVAQAVGQGTKLRPAAGRRQAQAMPWELLQWLQRLKQPQDTAVPDDHDPIEGH